MSNTSIFEKKWLDLVFENKNKSYGAYQLRQESPKTTLFAFFIGIAFLASFVMVLSSFSNSKIDNEVIISCPITTIDGDKIFEPKEPEIEKPKSNKPAVETAQPEPTKNTPMVVTEQSQADADVPTNEDLQKTNYQNTTGNETGTTGVTLGSGETNSNGTTTGDENVKILPPEKPFISVDVKPEFPGGMEKFYKYVATNFDASDLESETVVSIVVSFVVEKDGSISDIRVLRNPGQGLDKEAIRVLKSLKTKWKPGQINGQPVRSYYSLPIKVKAQ